MKKDGSGIYLVAVGDMRGTSKTGDDPFEGVFGRWVGADIVFGNFEAVICNEHAVAVEKAVHVSSPEGAEKYMQRAGFTVLNMAQNHVLDHGSGAALCTKERLRAEEILTIGVGRTLAEAWQEAVVSVRGETVAFVGVTESTGGACQGEAVVATLNEKLLLGRIRELAEKNNYVIVSLHWGTENVFYPSPSQQRLGRICIDSGACVVLGHHPHRVQGIERYGSGLIVYSLGNFNFHSCGVGLTPHENTSMICEITLSMNGQPDFKVEPVVIDGAYCPQVVEDKESRAALLHHFEEIARPLAGGIEEDWWCAEIARPYLTGNLKAFGIRIMRYGWRHAVACLRWLLSRYNRRIYMAVLRFWMSHFFRRERR